LARAKLTDWSPDLLPGLGLSNYLKRRWSMVKKVLLLVVAGAALGAGTAFAGGIGPRDVYTDGEKAGAVDVYPSAAKQFDVYSDGTRTLDRRDVFTDGARITNRDGYVDGDSQ